MKWLKLLTLSTLLEEGPIVNSINICWALMMCPALVSILGDQWADKIPPFVGLAACPLNSSNGYLRIYSFLWYIWVDRKRENEEWGPQVNKERDTRKKLARHRDAQRDVHPHRHLLTQASPWQESQFSVHSSTSSPTPSCYFSYWSKNGPIFLIETSCLGQKMTPGRGSPWHPLPGLLAEGSLVAGPGSPCGQPTRFLAYSPWPGQPLYGPGLVNWFSCPVPVNSPGWGLTSSMCLAWPVAFLGLLEPVFVLIQTSIFWKLAGFGSNLCLHLFLGSLGPGSPTWFWNWL